ncbi:hypothetical protein [Thalassobellus citreus]|uniref:hypothetical protein n=1 Tax=Thalassobellus citreus TaxID=3367752 RepID=UPI0037A20FAB
MSLEDNLYPFLKLYLGTPTWAKNFVGFIYNLIPNSIKYGKFYKEYYKRIKKFQHLDKLQTLIETEKLLILNVNEAIKKVEFYKKYKKIESIKEFTSLPVVTKDIINEDKELFINKSKRSYFLKANTGGSSGEPFTFYIHKGTTRSKEKAHFDWYWSKYGYKPRKRMLMLRGKALKNNVDFEYGAIGNKLIINCNNINENSIENIYDAIRKFKPDFIHAYPSALTIFTNACKAYLKKSSFELNLKAIFLGSEGVSVSDINYFENFYASKIVNWYGHSESLIHGVRYNLEEDFIFYPFYGYIELLDENDKVIIQPNKIGRIVATGFDNEVMPLIRYDTGDLGQISGNKKLINHNFVIKNIEGRDKNYIFLKDGTTITLTSLIFGEHYKAFEYIKELQVIQSNMGVILIKIVPLNIMTIRQIKDFEDSLLKSVKPNTLELRIVLVKETKKTSRGKHILLIQNFQNTFKTL